MQILCNAKRRIYIFNHGKQCSFCSTRVNYSSIQKKNIPCCEQGDNEKKKNGMLDDWALQMVGTQ